MGAYLLGVIQVCSVADKKFIEELETGYGDIKLPGHDYFHPYRLDDDLFQRPYFGFTVKYGSMSKIKGWLIELSNRHNQPIMVTMDYDSQFYDAFTNIPGIIPLSKQGWGWDGPFDRETDEWEERMTKNKEVVELPTKPDIVDFEAFNTAFMEYQASMRQELRRLILENITTADFKDISGLRVAANIVWNEEEAEEVVDGRG